MAKTSAMVIPFRAPSAAPVKRRPNVNAVNRAAVRNTFIRVSPVVPNKTALPERFSSLDSSCSGWLPSGLGRRHVFKTHGILASVAIHTDVLTGKYFPCQDFQRKRILNHPLDGTPQRSCAVGRVVAFLQQKFIRLCREL